jgi:hypothetical protein
MKRNPCYLAILALSMSSAAYAVPVLQVGAPAGAGDTGTYADYHPLLTNPTEADTALTSGNTIFVAGVYGPNVLNLGGQFGSGQNWSDFGYPTDFDTHGAVLLVSIPQGQSLTALTINGFSPFYTSLTLSGLFPNNHDPLKDNIADFLFFDIGDFDKIPNAVPDFKEETGAADGEIKTIILGGNYSDYSWLHFDVIALQTSEQGGKKNTEIVTTLANNPGSHDVTWKPETPPGGGQPAPEPGILWLLGSGLFGWRLWAKKG